MDEFNKNRFDDAKAAVDLTYGGIGARKSRGRANAPLSFKLQVAGMYLLNKLTLGLVPPPAMIRLLRGDNIPYTRARAYNFVLEKYICACALLAVASIPIALRYRNL